MAVRWGASAQPWQGSAVRRHAGEGWRRPFVRIAALWHTHPSPALRRASLADPKALFTLGALPLLLTGLAADILVWHLGALPYEFVWLGAVLVAGLVVGIGGVALWRAVLYALRAGRTVPSGWSAGLWLGFGVVVGELTGPRAAMNQWLPAHPEALLILVAALVLLMTWTAQNAAWWLQTPGERPPGQAMLAGLAVPALAYASVLYWWRSVGEVLTDGWPFTTAGVLASYGLPGLPPADVGPLCHVVAVLGLLPGALTGAGSLWWAQVLLWALPVLALVVFSRSGRGGGRSLVAVLVGGLAGGIVCSAGLAVALARLRDAELGPSGAVGPLRLAQMMVPVLVICAAMSLTAVVVAALTDSRWLTIGLAAAGITALVGVAAAHTLLRADAGSGPAVAWSLSWEVHLPYAVALGTLVAGLAAFVGRGAGLAGRGAALLVCQVTTRRRAGPHPAASPSPVAQRPLRRKWQRAVRLAAVGVLVTWVGATALAVDVSASPGPTSLPALVPDRAAPEPSATVSLLQHQAWAAAGGLERIEALRTAELRYSSAFTAVGEATDDTAFPQAMDRVTSACEAMDRATRRASAYFSVPSTA
ncbi:hypothetical protein ACFC1B_14320, partial [Streptomyces xiamenensis]|uniref:hypothetical protein n=1 Tax=Streptomyces xiamenensis TaxID=408015 RepID=UPI0035DA46CB